MEIIKGDLLEISHGLIAHQANCLGSMGAGVALALRKKYPTVYKAYSKLCNDKIKDGIEGSLLGTIQIVPVKDNPPLRIVNCFSQLKMGGGVQHTDYDAIESCFNKIKLTNFKKLPLYIPYQYGSGLGGGNWEVVKDIITTVYPEVIIVVLPSIADSLGDDWISKI